MNRKGLDAYIATASQSLDELKKALDYLDAQPNAPDRWMRLDAVAKRFEVSFEYVWRSLKAAGQYQGLDIQGPRPAILAAVRFGWVDDKQQWAGFLDARNPGVHDYFGLSSEEYAAIAQRFYHAARITVERIKLVEDEEA